MVPTIFSALAITLAIVIYSYLWRRQWQSMIGDFTVWIIFSVFLALTPLIFHALWAYIGGSALSFANLFANGELLIISVALGADAVGKLIDSGSYRRTAKILG